MKTYNKDKFNFIYENDSKKDPKNGDLYFNQEWRLIYNSNL